MLAPFQVRSFRFQFPADLITSWGFEMENVILGWYILVQTGSVLLLTVFGSLQYFGTLLAPLIGVAGDRAGLRTVQCAMRAIYATLGHHADDAGLHRHAAAALRVHHRHAGGAGAPVRPGDAQRAGGRDDADRTG